MLGLARRASVPALYATLLCTTIGEVATFDTDLKVVQSEAYPVDSHLIVENNIKEAGSCVVT